MYTNNLFTLNNISTISSDIVSTLPINKIPTLGEEGGNCAVGAGASRAVYAVRAADMVYVNVVQFGKVLLNAPMCGFCSVEALLAGVRRRLGEVCGVVTVNVRNCTCGWAEAHRKAWPSYAHHACRSLNCRQANIRIRACAATTRRNIVSG